ncbi:MAG: phosphodiesterase [Lysobacterales bacterium]
MTQARTSTLIAQITDCHLPADPRQKYRDIYPHQTLKALLRKVRAMNPDLLLATGDLSEDGSRASYLAMQKLFKPLGVPVLALPGNHDDAAQLADAFPGSPVDSIRVSEHGPWQIVRLNSCVPGKHEGHLCERALMDLEDFLEHTHSPLLITVHHQPICIGSPWIDKYRLFDSEDFLCLVDRHPNVRAVVWGHIHQAFETDRNGTAMLGGPSSAINALSGAQKFTPDNIGPAFRWLELRDDKTLESGII